MAGGGSANSILNLKGKGDYAELMVASDLLRRGHKIAIPYGEDCDFDLILIREERLERVQVKFVRSDGSVVPVRCREMANGGESDKLRTTSIPDDGASRIRTGDLSDANRTLCQLSYGPAPRSLGGSVVEVEVLGGLLLEPELVVLGGFLEEVRCLLEDVLVGVALRRGLRLGLVGAIDDDLVLL